MTELAGWLLLDLVLVGTGRLFVWLISLGSWRGERVGADEALIHGPAGALSFTVDGQRVFTRLGLLLIGLLFHALSLFLLLAWAASTRQP